MPDFLHLKNFLDPDTRDELWEFVRNLRTGWQETTFEKGPTKALPSIYTTRTQFSEDLEPWKTVFGTLMCRRSKELFKEFEIDDTSNHYMVRLNRNGADSHMGRHHDMGHGRKLTCVYYIHGQPRFGGGDFMLYGKQTHRIPVLDNSVLVFLPSTTHQVLPVRCGEAYEDGRFSMTVWLLETSNPGNG